MSNEDNIIIAVATDNNSIATESISTKLIEVSRVAESLDAILHETQDSLNIIENNAATGLLCVSTSHIADKVISSANTSDVSCHLLSLFIVNS